MKKLAQLLTIIIWAIFFYLLITIIDLKKIVNFEQRKLITPIITYVIGVKLDDEQKAFIQKVNPFGVLLDANNIKSKEQVKSLITELKLLFPERKLYIAIDQEGGQVDRLKKIIAPDQLLKEAKYYGNKAAYNIAEARSELYKDSISTAKMLAELGFDINFAPMVDLTFYQDTQNVKQSWAATEARSYSSEIHIVVELATIFIKAMHAENIITVIKHMPGLGRAYEDSHNDKAIINANYTDLLQKDFVVFKDLVHIAKMAMVGHGTYSAIDSKPATFSSKIINDIIRSEIKFKGLLIADALNMEAVSDYKLEDRVTKSLEAGIDIVIPNYISRRATVKVVETINKAELIKFNQKLKLLGY